MWIYAISSTRDRPKPVTFNRDKPQNSGKKIHLATWIVFPRLYKIDVFPSQRPFQILNYFLTDDIFFNCYVDRRKIHNILFLFGLKVKQEYAFILCAKEIYNYVIL